MSTKPLKSIISQVIIPRKKGFITEWDCTTSKTIALPFASGQPIACTVDWGDGTLSSVTTYNSNSHTYSNYGTYRVEITGYCPWSFGTITTTKSMITKVISWGDPSKFEGFSFLSRGFSGCNKLNYLPQGSILRKNTDSAPLTQIFYDCIALTIIPAGIFDNYTTMTTGVSSGAFASAFAGCTYEFSCLITKG